MERITERLPNGVIKRRDDAPKESAMSHLAYFEDLQEQGRLVVLPCKIGDTVYISNTRDCKECSDADYCDEEDLFYSCTKFIVSAVAFELRHLSQFGETVFITKEAAESALTDK